MFSCLPKHKLNKKHGREQKNLFLSLAFVFTDSNLFFLCLEIETMIFVLFHTQVLNHVFCVLWMDLHKDIWVKRRFPVSTIWRQF